MSTTTGQAMKHLTQRRATEAALQNEYLTRQRVDRLERGLGTCAENVERDRVALIYHSAILTRGFFGRLKWLFLGK